ncbi:MAG: acetylxylan esterase [Candidatus Brocadiia bacterium]
MPQPQELRSLAPHVLAAEERERLAGMLREDARRRLAEANRRDAQAWAAVDSRQAWERFRDPRVEALRRSLGRLPEPQPVEPQVTGCLAGDGYAIEKLVFASRPDLLATANLYRPEPPRERMPGILICHSHHNPKSQGELQDMGVNWARTGAMVLVMDQVGHGERGQQPFGGREDYRHRYILGIQLHLAGECLMGWMVSDLMRGVSILLGRRGADPRRIILVGAVAGGGDPAAVAAALDPRVSCVVPFNFGGPQPETPPLGSDAETTFNYAGSGSWESTRNLRLSARDGFLPWVIVAAAAPRHLLYAHEFAWEPDRDPVWDRLQRVYGFYDAAHRLASLHGWGHVKLRPPRASHCNNVGPPHREQIYPLFQRWFDMPSPQPEVRDRCPAEYLACLTAEHRSRPVHELAAELGARRAQAARRALEGLGPPARREALRRHWRRLLGEVEPRGEPEATVRARQDMGRATVQRLALEPEAGIVVPALLLRPPALARPPVVVAVAQGGKGQFLARRAREVAALLHAGVALCLPDLRGTGESRPDDVRIGRFGAATAIAATELMLGQTLLGSRLRDLRSVVRHLAARSDLDAARVALWGDSFAPVNPPAFEDPTSQDPPPQSEPLGGLLALFGALFEEGVRAALVRRCLTSFAAPLERPFCYVPADCVVPGALRAGDLCDVAAALAPRPLRFEALVNGRNQEAGQDTIRRALAPAREAYARCPERLVVAPSLTDGAAGWLAGTLRP